MAFILGKGLPHPMGAHVDENGVNFSLFSEHASGVELLLFTNPGDLEPCEVIKLDPELHKTYSFWHVYVMGAKAGMGYAYRVDGPWTPERGHRYNKNKVLIDPYSRSNVVSRWNRSSAVGEGDNLHESMRSVIVGESGFDWAGDKPLRTPKQNSIIYELHVGGFTKHENSGVVHKGKYLGLTEKIAYLKSLGVTAVELLPVHQFDPGEVQREVDGNKLSNFWGYSTVSYFAIHPGYCESQDPLEQINEFKQMVKAFHQNGIEVIMDVVFNHTSEGGPWGPLFCFRGLDNSVYYHLQAKNPAEYLDFSGCGNSVNANHPVVSKMIRESLEYFAREMHIDGFRLDLGSVLSRNIYGNPEAYPRVLWEIELSDVLADSKLFTEAWDATGLNEVGHFPGYRWSEWNGPYRDTVRRFVRGDSGVVPEVAKRISGSSDFYERAGEKPINSLNYVTCHDGYTAWDLVSYLGKNNWANGEDNRDGTNENYNCNYGVEGETGDERVVFLRKKHVKNLLTLLLLSQGVPMILAGDEFLRTQKGNNNAYCQDSPLSWVDWSLCKNNADMVRFVSSLVAFRRRHGVFLRSSFPTGKKNDRGLVDLEWHGCLLNQPGWDNREGKVLALTMGGMALGQSDVYVAANMEEKKLAFELPKISGVYKWYKMFDSSKASPDDVIEGGVEMKDWVDVEGMSVVVMESK